MQERGDEDDEIPENKFQDIIDESEPEEINDPSVKQFKMFKCACVELCSFSPDGEHVRGNRNVRHQKKTQKKTHKKKASYFNKGRIY